MSGKEYYNFLVLGAEATGKTCLCSCFTRGVFIEHHAPTIDVLTALQKFLFYFSSTNLVTILF
jgi:GTPase SAR1 family protein